MTRKSLELSAASLGINSDDWQDANVLDAILLGRRLLRTNAGAKPDSKITAVEATEDEVSSFESIGASLALQRAIMTVLFSQAEHPSLETIDDALQAVESRGKLHDALLSAELKNAVTNGITADPPEDIYGYTDGTVVGLLHRTLDLMASSSYGLEACAVANSLCRKDDVLERLRPDRYMETLPAIAAASQPARYPTTIKNNLSWIARNEDADDDRIARYLKAYGTTIDSLLERVDAL